MILAANLIVAFLLEFVYYSTVMLSLKDAVLMLSLLINLTLIRTLPAKQWLLSFLPLSLLLLMSFLYSDGVTMPVIASLRQILIPFLILGLGWSIGRLFGNTWLSN